MASLCLLCSFSMPQMEDLATSTIIIDEDVMLTDSGNTSLDIISTTLVSSSKQYDFGGCNHYRCEYDISIVSTGVYTAIIYFEGGGDYRRAVLVE
jgi:hypothetical protein